MVIGCLSLSYASVICRVDNPRRTSRKILGGFLNGVYRPGELISTVEMENIHPVDGYFGSEFSAISNHCGVWRPEVARR